MQNSTRTVFTVYLTVLGDQRHIFEADSPAEGMRKVSEFLQSTFGDAPFYATILIQRKVEL